MAARLNGWSWHIVSLSKCDRISGRIPKGVYPLGEPVRLQLLPLRPWRNRSPECGESAIPKAAAILTRTLIFGFRVI